MRNDLEGLIEPVSEQLSVEGASDADAVRAYLVQAAKVPLLSAAAERDLFARIEAAQHARDRALSAHRGKSSARAVRAATTRLQELKNEVIRANLRLVISVAKRYRYSAVPLLDRIQDGNIGLIEAVDRFDYHRGFKFSTYAVWWIRRSIYRGIAQAGRTIRLPGHLVAALNRIGSTRAALLRELGRNPTVEEVAARAQMTADKVLACLAANQPMVDLDAPVAEGTPLGAFLADDGSAAPDADLNDADGKRWLVGLLASLTPREQAILQWRFGLRGPEQTLEQVAQRLGLSRERVRQIEKRALERLRHHSARIAA
jgi:RNA polymerase sigma factor (sigma-70 family)